MKTMKLVSMAASLCAAMVISAAPSRATLYTFSFSGSDLVNYVTGNSAAGTTPVEAGVYDGAIMVSDPVNNEDHGSWQTGNKMLFATLKNNTDVRLTEFNLWGYGDFTNSYGTSTASKFGETFKVDITDWTNISVTGGSWGWDNTINTSGTLGKTVVGFGSVTGYTDGLAFAGNDNLIFTFTLDLDPATTPWYNGKVGSLVFWYGGYLQDWNDELNKTVDYGTLQGNMTLTGKAVPEPTTMLLFGSGIISLAFAARRRSK